jgi:hypothetical protein
MVKKIKTERRDAPKRLVTARHKLVAAARDYVLAAFDLAADQLTDQERVVLLLILREDIDLRRSEISRALETLSIFKQGVAP